MNSNFSRLPEAWKRLVRTSIEAEQQVNKAPQYAAMLCRKSMEEWIRYMYETDGDLTLPTYDTSLNTLMHTAAFQNLIAPTFFPQLNTIRKLGNDAVHTGRRINATEALHAVKLLHGFVFWVVNLYGEERIRQPIFNASYIPEGDNTDKTKAELRTIEAAYVHSREELKKVEAELEAIKALKTQNLATTPPPTDPDEALTRKLYIDSLLCEAGWQPTDKNVVEYPVVGMPINGDNISGKGKVDYVLWGDNGLPLAVVEAKRTTRDAKVGAHQAKLYADCLEQMHGQRPLIFYTNGFNTWLWDDTDYPPRSVCGFYTKDELQTLVNRRTQKHPLSIQPIPDIADRYYQQEAIHAVTEVLEKQSRSALLVMATGTCKTRTAAALIDVLTKANWAKRILFLADRTALIEQAKENINKYLPNLVSVNLSKEKDTTGSRLVFSTYQTMINQIDGAFDGDNRHFGVGYFDLIIFDEIHRSVYNRYKHIFTYFDGFRIGLTATPRSEGDKDTYGLFNLAPNDPTYFYELERAVDDKYLVPPVAMSVPLKFQRKGIKYAELTPEEQKAYELQFEDPITGLFPNEIESKALNEWLFNTDTVDKVIGHLMDKGIKVEGGDKLGKTIVFAKNHHHAMFIKERFDEQYPEYKGHFLQVIDNYMEQRGDILNTFKVANKMPQIAVSVDMLDTGIDVPEVVNLVFFKPIRSSTKYWQMIGRGTRLCPDLFGIGDHKKDFVIFDFCENFEFFNNTPKGAVESSSKSLTQRLFETRLHLAQILEKQDNDALKTYGKALMQGLIDQTKALKEKNFIVRQHAKIVDKYRDPNAWNGLDKSDISEIIEHIAPIVKEEEADEKIKRFDALAYGMQLATQEGKNQDVSVEKVKSIARLLSKKASIPLVAAKMPLLMTVQTDVYWTNPTVLGLEKLREDLRDLMRFIDNDRRDIVTTTYEDDFIGEAKSVVILQTANDLVIYKRKVERYFIENQHHITINKLKMNLPVTQLELKELERMLFEQGALDTKETFVKVYGAQPLGKFIRSIIGLDTEAVRAAFSEFLRENTFNSQQIRFIDTLINYFTKRGTVELKMLFEPAFTDINPNGMRGLFDETTTLKIRHIMDGVNYNAEVA